MTLLLIKKITGEDMIDKKIKVLFCFHYSNLYNGGVRSMVDVIENLMKKGDIIAYAVFPTFQGSAIDYLENLGVKIIKLPFYRNDYKVNDDKKININYKYIIKKFMSPVLLYILRYKVKKAKVDIVYSNTIVIDYGYIISKMLNLHHIWHIREFGKEDHDMLLRGGEKALFNKLNHSSAIIYISNSVREKFSPHIRKNILQKVVYNDISKSFINRKSYFNVDSDEPLRATIIGSIEEGKGQLLAIQGVEKANSQGVKIKLHICGRKVGSYFDTINNYVKVHCLSNQVIFDGFHTNMNEYRANMDIGIVASRSEAFGRVTIEGMLSNLVMVGSNSAGTGELITDSETGLLYEKDNVSELAEKLVYLYNNRKELQELALNGFHYAEKYTQGNAANVIYSIIMKLVL